MKTKPKPGRPAYEADEKTRAQVKMLAAINEAGSLKAFYDNSMAFYRKITDLRI